MSLATSCEFIILKSTGTLLAFDFVLKLCSSPGIAEDSLIYLNSIVQGLPYPPLMCACNHHLFLFLLNVIDNLILSNYPLLHRLHSNFPVLFLGILLGFIKSVARWLSGGKSWLARQCADRRAWNQRKGRVIQLIALNLRHSQSLQVTKDALTAFPHLSL